MTGETTSQTDLGRLLELQDVDQAIRRLQHHLDHLDEQQQLDQVTASVEAHRAAADEVRTQRDRALSEQRKLEHEVDLLRRRLDDEQSRMYGGEITNPRELQSLRAEVASTERRIAEREDRLLESMEVVEELDVRLRELDAQQADLERRQADATGARDDAAKGLLVEMAESQVVRDRLREGIAADLVERYDRAAGRSGGVGVGRLDQGMCTACRMELPMVEVNQLRAGPPLATCPNCRRLLVVGS